MISPDLLNILACPVCTGELHQPDGEQKLLCQQCRLAFPIRDDIPVLLVDQAEKIP